MALEDPDTSSYTWQDRLGDAPARWVDVRRVVYDSGGDGFWSIELAARPPRAADVEPGVHIAHGLVLDTTGDEVADYVVGLDNDAPKRGEERAWVTNLATGKTKKQVGPPYGYPVEFGDVPHPPRVVLTFLRGSAPADLDVDTVQFFVWTSQTRDGEVVAHDYAPDVGWITTETR